MRPLAVALVPLLAGLAVAQQEEPPAAERACVDTCSSALNGVCQERGLGAPCDGLGPGGCPWDKGRECSSVGWRGVSATDHPLP